MKKFLAVLLATSSVAAFADTFQDFNNNLYVEYNYTGATTPINFGSKQVNVDSWYNGWGVGGTFQSKNNVWVNASATTGSYGAALPSPFGAANANMGQINVRAGYAFQFFGNDDSGFQVIPYASFAAINAPSVPSLQNAGTEYSPSYTYGLGVQPEYRLLSSLKVALGLGLTGTQAYGVQSFNYNISPEVQYDISKTIMLAVGYTYSNAFNADQNVYGANGSNGVTAKVGYLF